MQWWTSGGRASLGITISMFTFATFEYLIGVTSMCYDSVTGPEGSEPQTFTYGRMGHFTGIIVVILALLALNHLSFRKLFGVYEENKDQENFGHLGTMECMQPLMTQFSDEGKSGIDWV
mmetsp:Transcript_16219/g.41240  ORF Transcript_16219/g.41240 Transcript_16219/m.41240 type:complete len:119 (+) Transcript_16219:1-357(+)